MSVWGLCRDEFQATGGWPHQIYVREGRRMISDYVVTEQGVAWMWGRDERQQARNLIEHAAHPSVRDDLWEEARALGLA